MNKINLVLLAATGFFAISADNVYAQFSSSQSKFLILKVAEQPQKIIADSSAVQTDGVWNETKEISSDVWDGTKEVSSDVWNGTKKVTEDVWDGAKTVGSDIKAGVTGDERQVSDAKDNVKK